MYSTKSIEEVIKEGAFLVDVRTPEEFRYGSVEGATNIPLDTVPEHIDDFKNKDNIVLFCQSGARCGSAKAYLESIGVENIYNGGSWMDVEYLRQQIENH